MPRARSAAEEDSQATEDKLAEQPEAEAEAAADDAGEETPPTQRDEGGETAYSTERLIAEANEFIGEPPHVVAGALHGADEDYMTLDALKERVKKWKRSKSPLTTNPKDEEAPATEG